MQVRTGISTQSYGNFGLDAEHWLGEYSAIRVTAKSNTVTCVIVQVG